MGKYLVVSLLLFTLPTVVFAQADPIPVRLLPVGGDQQTVAVNEIVSDHFVVQVVHAQTGVPLPQVGLHIFVNFQTCIPLDPNCTVPPPALYGQFEESVAAGLVTDGNGRATAPPFRAGELAGNYTVAAMLRLPAQQPGNVEYVGQPPDNVALFAIQQIAGTGAATPVPGPGLFALVLLTLAILVLAARRSGIRAR
jgi:hypothetical protein